MTSPNELAWNHAIETENFILADDIVKKHQKPNLPNNENEPQVSSATKEQCATLATAAYWGIDYGSLPNNEP